MYEVVYAAFTSADGVAGVACLAKEEQMVARLQKKIAMKFFIERIISTQACIESLGKEKDRKK